MKACTFLLGAAIALLPAASAQARIPGAYKWLNNKEAVFSYDGSFSDSACFRQTVKGVRTEGVRLKEKALLPRPAYAQNITCSPDSTKLAFVRGNDLWVADVATGAEIRLTFDGGETILNGRASWVYYEEIFGRPSRYKAFWWAPDSRSIAFYRFDDTEVPMFPIYSPAGQDGKLRRTHYPKVGEKNPEVRLGIASLDGSIVWAGFDPKEDQYFGTPFWAPDSRTLYVPHEPRIQNRLNLFAVNVADGSLHSIYHEQVPTWLDWPEEMLFTEKGIYMVRSFETAWQQIYFLSYDGATLKRVTDGCNWRIGLVHAQKDGTVFFTAQRDSHVRSTLYKVSARGKITPLTAPALDVADVSFAPDGRHFICRLSNLQTPPRILMSDLRGHSTLVSADEGTAPGQLVSITVDGLELPGIIYYPDGFDPARQYPVHVDIYGGPDTPLVTDRWVAPDRYAWYAQNGIIELIADCRAAGHNGRAGLDAIYKRLGTVEVDDFIAWARWLQRLPYVKADKIGVEGFSFGGTMTALLVANAPDCYPYGIAGGGVYDWMLYDTHYTERFMSTPEDNPEGYRQTAVIRRMDGYKDPRSRLLLTHGTADDNVHFQNTLQLLEVLQRLGAPFELMVYPEAKHGYRGFQQQHFRDLCHDFWLRMLL